MKPCDVIGMFRRKGASRCIEVRRQIQHDLDDGLDPANAARVAHHLDACRRCGLTAHDDRQLKTPSPTQPATSPPNRSIACAASLPSSPVNAECR